MSQLDDYFNALKSEILSGVDATSLRCEFLEMQHGNPEAKLALPLVLLGLGELDQIEDTDTANEIEFEMAMEAHCILPSKGCTDLHAIKFASEVVAVLNRNDFGLDYVGYPESFRIQPGDFTSIKKGYESRVVQWRQTISLDLVRGLGELNPFITVQGTHVLAGTAEPEFTDTTTLDQ